MFGLCGLKGRMSRLYMQGRNVKMVLEFWILNSQSNGQLTGLTSQINSELNFDVRRC